MYPALVAQPVTNSSGFSQASPHWQTAPIKQMGWYELIFQAQKDNMKTLQTKVCW